MKHTPGPWNIEAKEHEPFGLKVLGSEQGGHFIVCELSDEDYWDEKKNRMIENANLLASAPELLAIVKHLKEMFDSGADKVYRDSIAIGDDDRTLRDYVDAAIAKAEGRE